MGMMNRIDIDTRLELEREMDNAHLDQSKRAEYVKSNYSRVSIQTMVKYGGGTTNADSGGCDNG
jgi:hypothetical protein|tara:strand:- start:219 stop:410 length:192 start_codon:yes stop_codon:yes gene_type:complete